MRLNIPIHHVAIGMNEISLKRGIPESYPMCICRSIQSHLKNGVHHPLASELIDVLLDLKVIFKKDVDCMEKLKRRNIDGICAEHGISQDVLQRAINGDIITLNEKILIGDLR